MSQNKHLLLKKKKRRRKKEKKRNLETSAENGTLDGVSLL
jgi:hypothetical protein